MDLWQLHVFCKVIDHKSFSKAGDKIHLSQPTVSSHIRDLEEYFSCRLIDRLAKEAVPTKAGELLYSYARRLLLLRDEAEAALADFQGKVKGRIVIGGSTIPGVYIIPRMIGGFKAMYPEVTVSLEIGDTDKIIDETISGELEFGIVGAKTENRKIFQEKLLDDEMCLIVPTDHMWSSKKSIPLEMLVKESFILRERGSGTLKSIQQSLSEKGVDIDELNVIAEMGSTEAVCQGIKNKVGVSIVSTIAVAEEIRLGTLKALKVDGLNLKRKFYLTTHKYRSLSPLGNTFIQFIRKTLQQPERS